MARTNHRRAIWELDPGEHAPSWPYEDFEIVFISAFAQEFGYAPSRSRISGYLQRYFGTGVVPHWVRTYVRDELHGVTVGNLARAPLDPQIDLGALFGRLRERLSGMPPPPPERGRGDGWLRA